MPHQTSPVIGQTDGHDVTVEDLIAALQRATAMPTPVPVENRITEAEWAEAVLVRGEAPYGRCPWCGTAKAAAGCLNLCEMPAAAAQQFQNDMLDLLARRRGKVRWLETLGGCTCPPPVLHGYAIERDAHDARCPMTVNREAVQS